MTKLMFVPINSNIIFYRPLASSLFVPPAPSAPVNVPMGSHSRTHYPSEPPRKFDILYDLVS